jgi:hypothetical protein
VCVQRKSEGARDSRTCSGSRRRRDRAEVGAGASAAHVATRRGSDGGSATWGMWGRDSTRSGGRRRGRGVTRGITGSRRWCWSRCDGDQRRSTARADRGRRGEGRGWPTRGRGRRRWNGEGHVDGHRAALRRQRRHTWPEQRWQRAIEKTEEREREVDEGGPKCNIIEM